MRVFWFCIPAYGHTNPTIEVVRELVRRGHDVRYYSFGEFKDRIEDTGASFVRCDDFLPEIDEKAMKRLRKVSTTEMSVQSLETCVMMDSTVAADVEALHPDIVVSDSACFWGKLCAWKHDLPLVISTTTFAFNRHSASYMHESPSEVADLILGMPRVNRALKKLKPLGYHVKNVLELVQNNEHDDTIVYTSAHFQPASDSFDAAHYRFVGPSVRDISTQEKSGRPLVYVALGTVINDRPAFYHACVEALGNTDVDLLISCGQTFEPKSLEPLSANVTVRHSVDQLDVLSRASLFITHCGMNSVSEALYLGVPLLLFPSTGEQRAVARRACEVGAGIELDEHVAKHPAKLCDFILAALANTDLAKGAAQMHDDLRSCAGPQGAADFIEDIARAHA